MTSVSLEQIAHKLQLKNFTPKISLEDRMITTININRPALQLNGFFEHFDPKWIQLIGLQETSYLDTMSRDEKRERYEKLFAYEEIPCIILSRDFQPDIDMLELSEIHGIPILGSFKPTMVFLVEIITLLSYELAPQITIHGVLIDVYGIGVFIMGESGIGKSEAALELIRRGHRLVSDDVVHIRRINYNTLIGTSPEVTRYFIELRGVGIIDVKSLFGVESVKHSQEIDLVIKLSEWDNEVQYDRLGMSDQYHEILGVKLVCNEIPIRPGRNLAIICETAAANFRQKQMGYNAADELDRRVRENMERLSKPIN